MIKVVVNSKYDKMRDFVTKLPQSFEKEGLRIYEGRNIIKVFHVGDSDINVKRYCIPRWINRIFYSTFARTKAERAYHFPMEIIQRGFLSPEPIAYIEEYTPLHLLKHSFFVSMQCPFKHEMREMGNKNLDECRALAAAFARYTARLHKAGIMHKDYSPGNILFTEDEKSAGGYSFSLLDTNRMKFNDHLGVQECCAAFRRLWAQTPVFRFMAHEYADERGWNGEECERLILHYREMFWARYRKRHPIEFNIDI
jgi:serine/threonine protein kinase